MNDNFFVIYKVKYTIIIKTIKKNKNWKNKIYY